MPPDSEQAPSPGGKGAKSPSTVRKNSALSPSSRPSSAAAQALAKTVSIDVEGVNKMNADKERAARARRASALQEKESKRKSIAGGKGAASSSSSGGRKLPSPTLQQAGANSLGGGGGSGGSKSGPTPSSKNSGSRSVRSGLQASASGKASSNTSTRNRKNPVTNSRMNELSRGLEELSLDSVDRTPAGTGNRGNRMNSLSLDSTNSASRPSSLAMATASFALTEGLHAADRRLQIQTEGLGPDSPQGSPATSMKSAGNPNNNADSNNNPDSKNTTRTSGGRNFDSSKRSSNGGLSGGQSTWTSQTEESVSTHRRGRNHNMSQSSQSPRDHQGSKPHVGGKTDFVFQQVALLHGDRASGKKNVQSFAAHDSFNNTFNNSWEKVYSGEDFRESTTSTMEDIFSGSIHSSQNKGNNQHNTSQFKPARFGMDGSHKAHGSTSGGSSLGGSKSGFSSSLGGSKSTKFGSSKSSGLSMASSLTGGTSPNRRISKRTKSLDISASPTRKSGRKGAHGAGSTSHSRRGSGDGLGAAGSSAIGGASPKKAPSQSQSHSVLPSSQTQASIDRLLGLAWPGEFGTESDPSGDAIRRARSIQEAVVRAEERGKEVAVDRVSEEQKELQELQKRQRLSLERQSRLAELSSAPNRSPREPRIGSPRNVVIGGVKRDLFEGNLLMRVHNLLNPCQGVKGGLLPDTEQNHDTWVIEPEPWVKGHLPKKRQFRKFFDQPKVPTLVDMQKSNDCFGIENPSFWRDKDKEFAIKQRNSGFRRTTSGGSYNPETVSQSERIVLGVVRHEQQVCPGQYEVPDLWSKKDYKKKPTIPKTSWMSTNIGWQGKLNKQYIKRGPKKGGGGSGGGAGGVGGYDDDDDEDEWDDEDDMNM